MSLPPLPTSMIRPREEKGFGGIDGLIEGLWR